jgi:hypothetical protein
MTPLDKLIADKLKEAQEKHEAYKKALCELRFLNEIKGE